MTFEGEREWTTQVIYEGEKYPSISELSRKLKISRQSISASIKNNYKVKKKYVTRVKTDKEKLFDYAKIINEFPNVDLSDVKEEINPLLFRITEIIKSKINEL